MWRAPSEHVGSLEAGRNVPNSMEYLPKPRNDAHVAANIYHYTNMEGTNHLTPA